MVFIVKIKTYLYRMKTNVVVSSSDRELFGITIRQESFTGMLNVTDLQEAYTRARIENGWCDKRISDIVTNKVNLERFYYISKEQNLTKNSLDTFMQESESITPTKLLKKYNLYVTKGARKNTSVWANPYVWVLIAMELNPVLYAKVVVWLADKLIINRIEAGNFYKELSISMRNNFKDVDYCKSAKALNYVIFNKHATAIRNEASEDQLKKLHELEKLTTSLIDMGYIKTQDEMLIVLRKEWHRRHGKALKELK